LSVDANERPLESIRSRIHPSDIPIEGSQFWSGDFGGRRDGKDLQNKNKERVSQHFQNGSDSAKESLEVKVSVEVPFYMYNDPFSQGNTVRMN
jgi:hypothetical protein